jgi:methylated-DNA-protein-cysteine methyltransferase-like protein
MEPSFFERVYRVVKRIPRGKVASYGQIAALLGQPRAARTVGWALSSLTAEQAAEVPWQRVINHAGRISISRADLSADVQRSLLEEEGVKFDETGHVDWRRFRWAGLEWYEIEELWGDSGRTGEEENVERRMPNA